MNSQYSDYDTEQARHHEHAAAAQQPYAYPATGQTHAFGGATPQAPQAPHVQAPYGPQQPAYPAAPQRTEQNRRSSALALALIAFGGLMIFNQVVPSFIDLEATMVLLTISSGFLFFAFWRRIYGLLIPGSILAGLAGGIALAGVTDGASILWGLGLGFLAIDVVGRMAFSVRGGWGSIVATILFMIGTFVFILSAPTMFGGIGLLFPIAFIGLGIWLGRHRLTTP